MDSLVRRVFETSYKGDRKLIETLVEGPARIFFEPRLQLGEVNDCNCVITYMTKPTYLGVNIEEQYNPKFAYSFSLTEVLYKSQKSRIGEKKKYEIFMQIIRHPNPDPDNEVFWQIIQCAPKEGFMRLD